MQGKLNPQTDFLNANSALFVTKYDKRGNLPWHDVTSQVDVSGRNTIRKSVPVRKIF